MKKRLTDLLTDVSQYNYKGKDVEVTGVVDDSRKVKKDNLFVAVKGMTVDGHDYIDAAIEKGALVVIGEIDPKRKWLEKTSYVKIPDTKKVLGVVASKWFDDPSKKMKVIGVTGTDGKTTTVNILFEILKSSSKNVGMISTISAKIGKKEYDTGFHVTNPDPTMLHGFLAKMVDAGCKYALVEVTSHGIDQGRVEGVDFDIAVLTNITHEHLDYHRSFKDYKNTKAKLFAMADISVLNKDDESFEQIASKRDKNKIITYGIEAKNTDIKATNIKNTKKGLVFDLSSHDTNFRVKTNVHGKYNVSNVLAATATAVYLGVGKNGIKKALSNLSQFSGRFEEINNNKGFRTIVDFAHTPNALEKILESLREQTKNRLIVVFGCAGRRDTKKRELMPRVSVGLADISVFTAEDPRDEKIDEILSVMELTAKKEGSTKIANKNAKIFEKKSFISIPERGEAISYAIQKLARKGDTVVVCGKGHERSMAYDGVEYPWSDQEAVKMALKGRIKKIKR